MTYIITDLNGNRLVYRDFFQEEDAWIWADRNGLNTGLITTVAADD